LPAETEEDDYLKVLDKALEKVEKFNADILVIVLGVDTHKSDPLAGFKLKDETYAKISLKLKGFHPKVAIFAGGYSSNVPKLWYEFIREF
jgi:acetoin utilization deacetylase AcuC-like enzyme